MSFLISADELSTELVGPAAPVVLDASVLRVREPKPHYADGGALFVQKHLPSARHADLLAVFSDPASPLPFTAPDAAGFAAAAAGVGASRGARVVVYDVHDGTWAARLWWLFRAFGYDVRILDGGLRAWEAAGLPVVAGEERPARIVPDDSVLLAAAYSRQSTPPFVGIDVVERAIASGDALIVCGLRPAVYSGEEPSAGRHGHIPTSINIPYASLVDPETKRHRDTEGLMDQIGGAHTRVITYCGGGVNAAGVAFALLRAGATAVSVYDGSMSEWAADPDRPLVLGGHRQDQPHDTTHEQNGRRTP